MFLLHGQSTKDILVGGGFDLVKPIIKKLFNKMQLGIEGNYFIVRHFSVGAGLEHWTQFSTTSFVMGGTLVPNW